jgi:hypothetical protein
VSIEIIYEETGCLVPLRLFVDPVDIHLRAEYLHPARVRYEAMAPFS